MVRLNTRDARRSQSALVDRFDRQRRLTAIEYVQAQSIANKRLLEEKDPAVRSDRLNELQKIQDDRSVTSTSRRTCNAVRSRVTPMEFHSSPNLSERRVPAYR
jgi:hypothetical protein